MEIYFSDEQEDLKSSNPEKTISEIAAFVLTAEKQNASELSVTFVDKEAISRIHEEFYNDPSVTDCCSFPIDGPEVEDRVLGEIVICPQVAKEYAIAHKLSPYEELSRYLIHGLLHLLGYDDIQENDRIEMKSKEEEYLCKLSAQRTLFQPEIVEEA